MPVLHQRVECLKCRTHRDLGVDQTCHVCGADGYKNVLPTSGDVARVEEDVIDVAETIDYALLCGQTVTRNSSLGQRLKDACRELALVRSGVLCR